jgi:beta-aspartyl-peptidase (threonine type)
VGGISCTGYGEAIMKIVMAKAAAEFLRHPEGMETNPSQTILPKRFAPDVATLAARASVELLADRTKGTGGLILLDRHGNPGLAFNTPRMAHAYVQSDGKFVVEV